MFVHDLIKNKLVFIRYCQEQKGLKILGYRIICSHTHLHCKAVNGFIIRCDAWF